MAVSFVDRKAVTEVGMLVGSKDSEKYTHLQRHAYMQTPKYTHTYTSMLTPILTHIRIESEMQI